MIHRFIPLVIVGTLLLSVAGPAQAQKQLTVRQALIQQTYQEAFGRKAQDAELTYWDGRKDWSSKDQLMKYHLESLKGFPELQTSAVRAAYSAAGLGAPGDAMLNFWQRDLAKYPRVVSVLSTDIRSFNEARKRHVDESYRTAFGRPSSADEVKYWQTRDDWFGKPSKPSESLLELHRNYIKENDTASREVVENSYVNALRRKPSAGEMNYWLPQVKTGLLAAQLEAAHNDWFNKVLKPIVANPKIMADIKSKGMAIDVYGNLVTLESVKLSGNTIVAAGGGNIVAGGGGNIVAGGGGNIVAGGGGNVVAAVGTYLIGHDGSTLIGQGSSTLKP